MQREPAKIHLVAHFHYDPVWIEDQRTYARQAFDLVNSYLDACRRDPGYHIILSELDYLRPFLAAHGEHRQFILDLVSQGRVSTGGSYSEPNELSIQGEPLIRNLLYGRLFHEGVLRAGPTVYLPLDVFGHCLQLPQLAAKSGFRAIVWSKDIVGALPLCFALAPDGTALLQKHEHYWYHPQTFEEFGDTVADGLEHQAALGLSHDLRLLGMDMAAPREWLVGKAEGLAQRDPAIVLSTPEKYLAAVSSDVQVHRSSVPVSGRDLSFFHAGTLVTRSDLKIANRTAENSVLNAERWATLASLLGASYPDLALDKAWRQVLFGQHHDGITGCSSDIPYLDLLGSYREAIELAKEVDERSRGYIAGRVDTASPKRAPKAGAALVVFNPLSWERTDVCRARIRLEGGLANGFKLIAENGREVPCQQVQTDPTEGDRHVEIAFVAAAVPSLGYRTYYLAPAASLPPLPTYAASDRPQIENGDLSVSADPARGGCLTSIRSSRLNKEFVNQAAGLANEVLFLSEQPDREMAPWELFTTGGTVGSAASPATVEVLEGPVFSQLRSRASVEGRRDLVQEVTLHRGLPRVELRTSVLRYRGLHELAALSFPFDLPGAGATFEDRFATVVRRRSLGKLDFRTCWHRNISSCGLGAAQNWVDVGPVPSLAVMSGNRRVGSHPLGPCVVVTSADPRSRGAAQELMVALLARGVTCTHRLDKGEPEGDMAACAFRFSLGRGNAYSMKLLEANPEAAARLAEAVARQPWGGVLLRRPDPQGEWPDVPVLIADTSDPGGTAKLADLLAAAVRADELAIAESHDFSGLAAAAPDQGIALINRGAFAASLENDGTLVAPLFHTSSWSTYQWGEGMLDRFLVPEHRSHIYEHVLLPHAGDWRRGELVKAGHEANSPLRAVQLPVQSGDLPATLGLVSPDQPNLIISALKPLGNPLAEHRATVRSRPSEGILIRAYEAEGRPVSANLRFFEQPTAAWTTDLMEAKVADVEIARGRWGRPPELRVEAPACGIVSLAVKLQPSANLGRPAELGPSAEPYSPVYARYWDHNLGPAPMGNLPLSLWLRGSVPVGQNTRFSLGVNNDSLDREISGSVTMTAPDEWTMIPRQVPYRVAPNSTAVYEVMVIVPPEAKPCFIRATIRQGDREVQDVIPVGEVRPLEGRLQRDATGFSAVISNPNDDYVDGHVTLITPLETWGEVAGASSPWHIGPRMHAFRLEAGEERAFRFSYERPRPEAGEDWAVARVAWYGNVRYLQESSG